MIYHSIQVRGEPREVVSVGDQPGELGWWLLGDLDPPLTDYEDRAITAIVEKHLREAREEWRAQKRARYVSASWRRGEVA